MTAQQIGIIGCIALVVLLCSSMPVAFAMAVVGVVGFALVRDWHAAMSMTTLELYKIFASYSLTVIPLFVLIDRKSTRLNSSHESPPRLPSSA